MYGTVIRFTIPEASTVRLVVYDDAGHAVKTLVNGFMAKGQHTITWNPQNVSGGSYYYTIYTRSFVQTLKMLLLR